MAMRTNLKESNALNIERHYNNVYITLSTLKGKIEDEFSMIVNKENRCSNMSRISREGKNSHDDALRLLAQK